MRTLRCDNCPDGAIRGHDLDAAIENAGYAGWEKSLTGWKCGECTWRESWVKRCAAGEIVKPRLMHQQRLDGKPDDLMSVTKHGEIKPATARERQLRLFGGGHKHGTGRSAASPLA